MSSCKVFFFFFIIANVGVNAALRILFADSIRFPSGKIAKQKRFLSLLSSFIKRARITFIIIYENECLTRYCWIVRIEIRINNVASVLFFIIHKKTYDLQLKYRTYSYLSHKIEHTLS